MTAFWLVPELGTDQVLAVGAATLVAAALVVALAVRLVPAAVVLAGGPGRWRSRSPSRSRRTRSRTLSGRRRPELVAALPPAREPQAGTARSGLDRRARRAVHGARRPRHAVPPAVRRRRLRLALPPLRQLLPERDVARRTRTARASTTPTTSISASRTGPSAKDVLFIGLGGGSAPKRIWRDFPRLQLQVVELDPGGRRRRVPLVRPPARPSARGRRRRRPPLADAPRRSAGT